MFSTGIPLTFYECKFLNFKIPKHTMRKKKAGRRQTMTAILLKTLPNHREKAKRKKAAVKLGHLGQKNRQPKRCQTAERETQNSQRNKENRKAGTERAEITKEIRSGNLDQFPAKSVQMEMLARSFLMILAVQLDQTAKLCQTDLALIQTSNQDLMASSKLVQGLTIQMVQMAEQASQVDHVGIRTGKTLAFHLTPIRMAPSRRVDNQDQLDKKRLIKAKIPTIKSIMVKKEWEKHREQRMATENQSKAIKLEADKM
jgi:hypothetical protein